MTTVGCEINNQTNDVGNFTYQDIGEKNRQLPDHFPPKQNSDYQPSDRQCEPVNELQRQVGPHKGCGQPKPAALNSQTQSCAAFYAPGPNIGRQVPSGRHMGVGPPKDGEAVLLVVEPTAHKASTTRVARRNVFIGRRAPSAVFFIQFCVAFSAGQDYSKCGIWLSDPRTGLYGEITRNRN